MLNLELMNKWAKELLSGDILQNYQPFEANLNNSVQIEKSETLGFKLDINYGKLSPILNPKSAPQDEIAILRIPISYISSLKMVNNQNHFNFVIMNLVNMSLTALVKEFGDLSNKKVVCGFDSETYLKEMENLAAIELRFVVLNKE